MTGLGEAPRVRDDARCDAVFRRNGDAMRCAAMRIRSGTTRRRPQRRTGFGSSKLGPRGVTAASKQERRFSLATQVGILITGVCVCAARACVLPDKGDDTENGPSITKKRATGRRKRERAQFGLSLKLSFFLFNERRKDGRRRGGAKAGQADILSMAGRQTTKQAEQPTIPPLPILGGQDPRANKQLDIGSIWAARDGTGQGGAARRKPKEQLNRGPGLEDPVELVGERRCQAQPAHPGPSRTRHPLPPSTTTSLDAWIPPQARMRPPQEQPAPRTEYEPPAGGRAPSELRLRAGCQIFALALPDLALAWRPGVLALHLHWQRLGSSVEPPSRHLLRTASPAYWFSHGWHPKPPLLRPSHDPASLVLAAAAAAPGRAALPMWQHSTAPARSMRND
ncbi:hypothetical protein PCL_03298 [Purpureocillium lilacinum]|uniref:Uncharacterized protein n=1 Tax=Purpureocillium lilacinum TaxID=33203 RepID=A0A2U3ENM7_PURLI|nr:hypothetical protein PCL_03298 [Purpureocillium lilacinum]